MKKLIAFIALIGVSQLMLAENGNQIFLTNNYGDDVAINLVWKKKNGHNHLYQDVILEKNTQDFDINIPTSFILEKIDATPAANIYGSSSLNRYILAGGLTAYAVGLGAVAGANLSSDFFSDSSEISLINNIYSRFFSKKVSQIATAGVIIALMSVAFEAISVLGTAISKSKNHHLLDTHQKSNYFVIEHTGHDSKITGQKKITIKQYASQKHYEDEVAKTQN